jgi:fucose 4-O-acetylase-like acetyltransferase
MALFAFFVRFCDVGNWSLRVFALFGQNALVVYLLQGLIGNAWLEYGPRDAPLWFAFALWLGYLGVMCLFLRHLDRQGIHIKL